MYSRSFLVLASVLSLGLSACMESPRSSQSNLELAGDEDALFQTRNITAFELGNTKKLVLTYDDGPTPGVTDEILKTLREYNVKATFFVLGNKINTTNEYMLKRMSDDGHIVANHTQTHPNLAGSSFVSNPASLFQQIGNSHRAISKYMSPSHRLYFRAPFGAWNSAHAARLNADSVLRNYIGPIFWNIGGELKPARPQTKEAIYSAADWNCWSNKVSAEICAEGYYKEITRKGGGIILLHDIMSGSARLTKLLIPRLLTEGYEFITLDDVRSLDQYQ